MTVRIRVDESRLNFPLIPISAGVLSSLDFEVVDVPDVDALAVFFEYDDGTVNYQAACVKVRAGFWTGYAMPYTFPAENATGALHYHVVATDARGNQKWLGTGELDVYANPANGSPTPPPIVPHDTYIRNPVTGLYHLLTATVDEDGNLTLNLSDEGETR